MSKIFTGLLSLFLVCLWLSGCVPGETEFPEATETQGVLSTHSKPPGAETLPVVGTQTDGQGPDETVKPSVMTTAPVTPSPMIATSSSTPTQEPTATPSQTTTQLAPTTNPETPTPFPQALKDMRIFVWSYNTRQHSWYGCIQPFNGITGGLEYCSFGGEGETLAKRPVISKVAGFSKYSNQVAYLIQEETGEIALWIASLNLSSGSEVWRDSEHWLGVEPVDYEFSTILWGPGDNSVLFFSDDQILVYSLKNQTTWQWKGVCEAMAVGKNLPQLALWCEINQIDGAVVFGVIEFDGEVHIENDPPGLLYEIYGWSYSRTGEVVAYQLEDQVVIYHQLNDMKVTLPLLPYVPYHNHYDYFLMNYAGTRLLMLGDDPAHQLCPKVYNNWLEPAKYEDYGCWMVIDTETGEIIWRPVPTDPIAAAINSYPGTVEPIEDALISPDGEWLALFTISHSIRYGVLVRIATGEVIFFTQLEYWFYTWEK